MTAYYNEIDPFAAEWLRQLIKAGAIAPGEVDERDIRDVKPEELKQFTQCHFFAGIGVWSYSLRSAGWPDDKPVWTASCPCQPFSKAGKEAGFDDERHLWPNFYHIASQLRPPVIFGEQVASKLGRTWLDIVQADMEALGFAFGSADLCAAGVGAPHIRQRLFFVAERLADTSSQGLERRKVLPECRDEFIIGQNSLVGRMANSDGSGSFQGSKTASATGHRNSVIPESSNDRYQSPCETNGFWRSADWIGHTDEKFRPVEPGAFPLADGVTGRVGRLRGYGNAINAEVAKEFIKAYMATL